MSFSVRHSRLFQSLRFLSQQSILVWARARTGMMALAAIGLTGCVVLPADTVVYDDGAPVSVDSAGAPDVVIIDRRPAYLPPPPLFWYDSHWGHRPSYRHWYHHRYNDSYRDGRRPRVRGGARWEGRPGRDGADRGARPRSWEFRGRIRSDSSSGSMNSRLQTK